MHELVVIIPSFKTDTLLDIAVSSFEKFRPHWLNISYVVIENSASVTPAEILKQVVPDRHVFVSNPTDLRGSEANAEGIEIGLRHVTTRWSFLAHSDTCVTSPAFFDELARLACDHEMVGTVLDPSRIGAVHISGMLVKTALARSVSLWPRYENGAQVLDAGDSLTELCRERGIRHTCMWNTFNMPKLADLLDEPMRSFNVDRCVLSDPWQVIFMHLGRGVPKAHGTYLKPGKVDHTQWTKTCRAVLV